MACEPAVRRARPPGALRSTRKCLFSHAPCKRTNHCKHKPVRSGRQAASSAVSSTCISAAQTPRTVYVRSFASVPANHTDSHLQFSPFISLLQRNPDSASSRSGVLAGWQKSMWSRPIGSAEPVLRCISLRMLIPHGNVSVFRWRVSSQRSLTQPQWIWSHWSRSAANRVSSSCMSCTFHATAVGSCAWKKAWSFVDAISTSHCSW